MVDTNREPEVKDVDRVEIAPAPEGSETVEAPEGTGPDSSQGNEGEPEEAEGEEPETSPEGKPEALVRPPPPAIPVAPAAGAKDPLQRLPDESDREYAMRLEIDRLRNKDKGNRIKEMIPDAPILAKRGELSEEDKQVLAKYPKEQLNALAEVLPALAKQLGFVKADELATASYAERAQGELESFIEKHPEYLPENDKDGTLWNALRAETAIFKQPTDPRDLRRILERSHQQVFGIKPAGALPNNDAAARKTSVASHGSAAGPGSQPPPARRAAPASTGLRTDMLKGFSQEEIDELTGGA